MKLSLAFTFQYLIFSGIVTLLTPAKFIYSSKEMMVEKKLQNYSDAENMPEVLPADIFFKY